MPAPLISVVMPVYNERSYLEESINSILKQSYKNFELIIVNDGSSDGSKEIINNIEKTDRRIKVKNRNKNKGCTQSLNSGLNLAEGKYIAIMDGDDISYPERLERQVQFLEDNPDIGILGTAMEKIDAQGKLQGRWCPPTDPDVIAWKFFFNTCMGHPTAMMRRSVLEELGGYAEWAPVAQDYELWTRAVLKTRLKNLPDVLLKLRRHEGSATIKRREEQIQVCVKAATELHRSILDRSVDKQIIQFLVWLETKGIEKAVQVTGIRSLAPVHEYLRFLHEAYTHQFLNGEPNVQVQRHALSKLNTIASRIVKSNGIAKGAFYKLSSVSVLTLGNILPLTQREVIKRWGVPGAGRPQV